MDQTQDRRKREDTMKEKINTKDLVIQQVLAELIDITRLLIQQRDLMHLNIP
jgi:hypothetical protein